MKIEIRIHQLGKKLKRIHPVPFTLAKPVSSVRELIAEVVRGCVRDYNARVRLGESAIRTMAEADMESLAAIGKLAFGVNYGRKEADENAAIENALQSFEDGLCRIFLKEAELTSLDQPIDLHDGDVLTFIRLVMLTGTLW